MKTVAILGYGGRGRMYALLLRMFHKKQAKVVAVIDHDINKLQLARKENKLSDSALYDNYDKFIAGDKVADWLFVCTQDSDHYAHTIPALKKRYDVLLEKPISTNIVECNEIAEVATKLNRKVAVCHVLRYTYFYDKIKQIADSGILGDIVALEMQENVGYWHQAHSYVRGDWRNTAQSSPMIFAKCCHDLDLATYILSSPCDTISSVGKLHHFKKEHAPQGSADRCVDCKVHCPYNAEKWYLKRFKKYPLLLRKYAWPMSRLVPDSTPTIKKLKKAIAEGQFGRCVYKCDNDVVDYQTVTMQFANGVQGTLTMTAFSHDCFRTIQIRGTNGTVMGNFEKNALYLNIYGKKPKKIKPHSTLGGHGGGDTGLIKAFAEGYSKTDINLSIHSHVMAYAAEASRLNNGIPVDVNKYLDEVLSQH